MSEVEVSVLTFESRACKECGAPICNNNKSEICHRCWARAKVALMNKGKRDAARRRRRKRIGLD